MNRYAVLIAADSLDEAKERIKNAGAAIGSHSMYEVYRHSYDIEWNMTVIRCLPWDLSKPLPKSEDAIIAVKEVLRESGYLEDDIPAVLEKFESRGLMFVPRNEP